MLRSVSNKKAMSPLIALIILVSIAVSLGVLVINIINLITAQEPNIALCGDVDFNIKRFKDTYFLCVEDGNRLSFVIENTGKKEIASFKISVVGSSKSYSKDLEANLAPGDLLDKRQSPLPYGLVGILYEVKILPYIRLEGSDKLFACTEKAKSYVDLPKCSVLKV